MNSAFEANIATKSKTTIYHHFWRCYEMRVEPLNFPEKVFVTGTDTGVGKTVVAAILTAGLEANYWKPVQCGLDGLSDTEVVRRLTGLGDECFFAESYRLQAALSPHAASALEDCRIDLAEVAMPVGLNQGHLVVEGAGGIMVPLNEHDYMLDLIKKLGIPVVLTARSGLGTINHSLMSIEILRQNKIELLGVVLNGPLNSSNRQAIETYGRTKVLAEIELMPDLLGQDLRGIFYDKFSMAVS